MRLFPLDKRLGIANFILVASSHDCCVTSYDWLRDQVAAGPPESASSTRFKLLLLLLRASNMEKAGINFFFQGSHDRRSGVGGKHCLSNI